MIILSEDFQSQPYLLIDPRPEKSSSTLTCDKMLLIPFQFDCQGIFGMALHFFYVYFIDELAAVEPEKT
jgi:hypothetical protein